MLKGQSTAWIILYVSAQHTKDALDLNFRTLKMLQIFSILSIWLHCADIPISVIIIIPEQTRNHRCTSSKYNKCPSSKIVVKLNQKFCFALKRKILKDKSSRFRFRSEPDYLHPTRVCKMQSSVERNKTVWRNTCCEIRVLILTPIRL